jgi:hemerythrin-like domain-containing protein
MRDTLARWHADHVNFSHLLHLLDGQLALFHDGASPDYELMLDIMYYMTHYSDVVHHPKEDLVFARVKERDPSTGVTIDALTAQHVYLKQAGEALAGAIDDVVNGSVSSRAHVEARARSYTAEMRSHMGAEEATVLPAASRLLTDDDWKAVEAALAHVEDPLFGSSTHARYAGLRREIARHAASMA